MKFRTPKVEHFGFVERPCFAKALSGFQPATSKSETLGLRRSMPGVAASLLVRNALFDAVCSKAATNPSNDQ